MIWKCYGRGEWGCYSVGEEMGWNSEVGRHGNSARGRTSMRTKQGLCSEMGDSRLLPQVSGTKHIICVLERNET